MQIPGMGGPGGGAWGLYVIIADWFLWSSEMGVAGHASSFDHPSL